MYVYMILKMFKIDDEYLQICFTKSSFFCHFGVGIKYVMHYLRKKMSTLEEKLRIYD